MYHTTFLHRLVIATFILLCALGGNSARSEAIDIFVGGVKLGDFTVEKYQDTSPADGSSFSIAVQGGFKESGSLLLPPGYEYRWVQTVSTNAPINDWQLPNQPYIDRTRVSPTDPTVADHSPFYISYREPGQGYTLPFLDNPQRLDTNFTGTWALTLVAVAIPSNPADDFDVSIPGAGRGIYAITTFGWGFSTGIQANGKPGVNTPLPTIMQVDPGNLLATAFANDLDTRTFGGDAWTLFNGFPDTPVYPAVPEPASIAMALSAILGIGSLMATRRLPSTARTDLVA